MDLCCCFQHMVESISQDDFDDELYDDTDDDEIDYPLPDFSSSDEDDN